MPTSANTRHYQQHRYTPGLMLLSSYALSMPTLCTVNYSSLPCTFMLTLTNSYFSTQTSVLYIIHTFTHVSRPTFLIYTHMLTHTHTYCIHIHIIKPYNILISMTSFSSIHYVYTSWYKCIIVLYSWHPFSRMYWNITKRNVGGNII